MLPCFKSGFLCSIFVFCILLPRSWTQADYYRYLLIDDEIPPKEGSEVRFKRYVEEAIPRLADDYHGKSYSYTDKSMEKVSGGEMFGGGGINPFAHRKRMEMIGNVAVPAFDDPAPPEHKISNLDHSTTESTAKKTTTKKKALDLTKKSDDVLMRKMEKLAATSEATPEDDPSSLDFPDDFVKDITNDTLHKYNITSMQEDHHVYYNSTYINDAKMAHTYWVNMDNETNVIVNEFLSQHYRRALVVKLSFPFPYYGHIIRNITVTTGGFLYTGDQIHNWLASTQYIAPLMANFDTSISNNSHIKYRDNGKEFTVEWNNISLHDQKDRGSFSFQVTLKQNGNIIFVYRKIPIPIDDINQKEHPVKVGLSDAYIIDYHDYVIKKKTFYEYHSINFMKNNYIGNWTVFIINALPTCLSLTDCNSCLTEKITFDCKWCSTVGRCSTGLDRKRQDWESKKCNEHYISDVEYCSTGRPSRPGYPVSSTLRPISAPRASPSNSKQEEAASYSGHTSSMIGIIFTIMILSGIALWVFYAYKNPHTPSGQVLIKYRPSLWTLRRGEARYTPATIHM